MGHKLNTYFYNREFARCLSRFNSNLYLYKDQPFGSENSIKDSVYLIANLEARSMGTTYNSKYELSLMSALLKDYFITNNNETIRVNSDIIKQYISEINKDINKSNNIDEFISYLTPPKQK